MHIYVSINIYLHLLICFISHKYNYIIQVKESSVDLLSDANNEFTNRVKLRFELRLKSKNYKSIEAFTNFAEGIPDYAVTVQFAKDLIKQLSIVSNKMDGLDHSRYGWMTTADIEVSNVLVLPKATARDPFDTIHSNNDNSDSSSGWFGLTDGVETIDLILAGVALGAMFFLSIMVCMYYRLRQEHDALEKDKVTGGSIRRMWDRFIQLEQIRKLTGAKQEYEYKELRMEEFSSALETGKLTAEDDTQLDVEDEVANRS